MAVGLSGGGYGEGGVAGGAEESTFFRRAPSRHSSTWSDLRSVVSILRGAIRRPLRESRESRPPPPRHAGAVVCTRLRRREKKSTCIYTPKHKKTSVGFSVVGERNEAGQYFLDSVFFFFLFFLSCQRLVNLCVKKKKRKKQLAGP